MKFGHNLPRNQVPEWASAYIDYKGLKKLIKAAGETARNKGREPDLAGKPPSALEKLLKKHFCSAFSRILLFP